MKEIWEFTYSNPTNALINTIIFLSAAAILLWLLWLLLTKTMYKKEKMHSDGRIELSYLWALTILLIVISAAIIVLMYFFFPSKSIAGGILYGFIPFILFLIIVTAAFFSKTSSIKKAMRGGL